MEVVGLRTTEAAIALVDGTACQPVAPDEEPSHDQWLPPNGATRLEFPSNARWNGEMVDVRSIFVIRRAMLLSSLLQPSGVGVGNI